MARRVTLVVAFGFLKVSGTYEWWFRLKINVALVMGTIIGVEIVNIYLFARSGSKDVKTIGTNPHTHALEVMGHRTKYLPPAMKLQQGNVFTSLCQKFCPRWGGRGVVCLRMHHRPHDQGVGSMSRGGLCPGGLCPGGLCPGVSIQGDLCPGSLCPGGSLLERPPDRDSPSTAMSGQYASYWNAFLSCMNTG